MEELQDLAAIIDCIADLVTLSVAGCMGAQIHHEMKKRPRENIPMGAPETNEMVR